MLPSRLGPAARSSRVVNSNRLHPARQPWYTRVLPGPSSIRWVSIRRHYGSSSFALTRGVPTPVPANPPGLLLPQTPGQVRGKKTKTVVSLDDLPQGVIRAGPLPPRVEEEPPPSPAYPTVVLQARRNMQKFDNCVLLTRVGGFYELYFEHADEYGPLLNLKVAQKKTAAGSVSMVISALSRPLVLFHSSPGVVSYVYVPRLACYPRFLMLLFSPSGYRLGSHFSN